MNRGTLVLGAIAAGIGLAACSGGDGDSFIEGETPTSSEAASAADSSSR